MGSLRCHQRTTPSSPGADVVWQKEWAFLSSYPVDNTEENKQNPPPCTPDPPHPIRGPCGHALLSTTQTIAKIKKIFLSEALTPS